MPFSVGCNTLLLILNGLKSFSNYDSNANLDNCWRSVGMRCAISIWNYKKTTHICDACILTSDRRHRIDWIDEDWKFNMVCGKSGVASLNAYFTHE